MRATALLRNDFRPFASAIDRDPLGLIAEVKKASPSAGVIAESFDPVKIARTYQSAGADAISVLTDEQFFQGRLSYLTEIRKIVSLPLLRKDFILHEVQIYESACAGADAILLIVAALEKSELTHLFRTPPPASSRCWWKCAPCASSTAPSISMPGSSASTIATWRPWMSISPTTQTLTEQVPDEIVLVSESGIKTPADARQVSDWGVNAILVGETLMRAKDVHAAIEGLTVFPE